MVARWKLERSPEQMPLVNVELSQKDWEKKPSNRKLDQARSVSLHWKAVYLNKNDSLNTVLPNDSDDCELEDKAREVEWLFEEVNGPSSK